LTPSRLSRPCWKRPGANGLFQRVMRGVTGVALPGFGGTLAATAF